MLWMVSLIYSLFIGSRRYPSPDNSDQEPMTLKVNDILHATIERQLRIQGPISNNNSVRFVSTYCRNKN